MSAWRCRPRATRSWRSTANRRPSARWNAETDTVRPIGYEVALTYRHADEREAVLRFRDVTAGTLLIVRFFMIAAAFVGLLYYGIALLALFKQGHTAMARVLALLNLTLAMLMASLPGGIIDGMRPVMHVTPLWAGYQNIVGALMLFATGFGLHLALLFPAPVIWLRGRRWLLYLLCYAPGLMALPAKLFAGSPLASSGGTAEMLSFFQFVAAIVYLWRGRRRATTTLERRKSKRW